MSFYGNFYGGLGYGYARGCGSFHRLSYGYGHGGYGFGSGMEGIDTAAVVHWTTEDMDSLLLLLSRFSHV